MYDTEGFPAALLCFCRVLTTVRCQVGSSSSQSPSRSREVEQLPWQHWWSGGARGTLMYDIGMSPFTQAYHKSTDRRLHPPTLEDHSHRAKPFPTKGLIILLKPFKMSPLQTCQTRLPPAIYKTPLTALHTAFSHPPLPSSALCTHTYLPTQSC